MLLEQIHPLLLVYAAYLIAVASPGPSTMAIMGVAMGQGRASAVALALGVMTGSMVWAALAAVGISAILSRFAEALFVLKIVGGLYLLFLARKSARAALSPRNDRVTAEVPAKRLALYRKGVLLHVTNPKSILGWTAIITLGLGPDAPPYTLAAIIGGCALLGLLVFVGYAVIFSTAPVARAYQSSRRWVEGALALVFGYAGLRLLLSKA
jgi:threonine/homoserine/homoserine lactone efflux protein